MFCHKCGKVIQDDSVFCRYCGANVELKNEEKIEPAPEVEKNEPIPQKEEPKEVNAVPDTPKEEGPAVKTVEEKPSERIETPAEPEVKLPVSDEMIVSTPVETDQSGKPSVVNDSATEAKPSSVNTDTNRKTKLLTILPPIVAVISMIVAILLFLPKTSQRKIIKNYSLTDLEYFMKDPRPSEVVDYFDGFSRIESNNYSDSNRCTIYRYNLDFYGYRADMHANYTCNGQVYDKNDEINYDIAKLEKNKPSFSYAVFRIEKDELKTGDYDQAIELVLSELTKRFGKPEKDINESDEDGRVYKTTVYSWSYSTARQEYLIALYILDWRSAYSTTECFWVEIDKK